MFHDPYFKRWRQKNYLALAPGASYQAKRVPLAIWVAILRGITSSLASDLEVVLLGDDKDATIASELHQAILDQRLLGVTISNECGQLSLTQSAMVLANCRGLLTNDSSLGHICEAVGRPVATLFGPTCEGFGFVPHLEASGAFSTDEIGCRPCSVHGQSPCRYKDYACFHRIDLQPIVEKVYTWLS
jgi:heptosyltransferase-2